MLSGAVRDDEFVVVEDQRGRTGGPRAGIGYALALARSGREQNRSVVECDREISAAIRGDACHLAVERGQGFDFRHALRGIKGPQGGAA
jgi:hypothetical protein